MPSVKQDNHASSVIAIEEHDGVSVLVHDAGRYPSLLDDAGSPIERYIEVIRAGDGYFISACAGYGSDDRLMSLHVGTAETLEAMRDLYPAARRAVDEAPTRYAEYHALMKRIPYEPLTRETYETLATEWGFPARADCELSEWGDFGFPEYALADLPRLWIDQRRAWGAEREKKEDAAAASQVAERARRAAVAVALQSPPVRMETRFVPLGLPGQFLTASEVLTVVVRSGRRRITEDDPSVYGTHLLGYEGEYGETVSIEVRSLALHP